MNKCLSYILYKSPGDMEYKDDIFQELCVIIMEYPPEKITDILNKGRENAFITRVLRNMILSNTSAHYYTYKKYSKVPEIDIIDETPVNYGKDDIKISDTEEFDPDTTIWKDPESKAERIKFIIKYLLSPGDRALFIIYARNDYNVIKFSKAMDVSYGVAKRKIWQIKVNIKKIYDDTWGCS